MSQFCTHQFPNSNHLQTALLAHLELNISFSPDSQKIQRKQEKFPAVSQPENTTMELQTLLPDENLA